MTVAPWKEEVMVLGAYERWRSGSGPSASVAVRGGACLVDLPTSTASPVIVPDPVSNEDNFDLWAAAPHPYLQDAWFFAPLVNAEAQANCIFELDASGNKDFAWEDMFTACNDPMPFVLHRVTGKWHRGPLSIAGLPSLAALDLAARQSLWGTYQTVELAYATQGSGAFRGSLRW